MQYSVGHGNQHRKSHKYLQEKSPMESTKLKTIGGLERASSGGCGQRPAFNSLRPWLKVGKNLHAHPPHEGIWEGS